MRALATFLFACFLCACTANTVDPLSHITSLLGVSTSSPANRIITCARSLGFTKCMKALSAWRAENAIRSIRVKRDALFSLRDDVERFPWEQYTNTTDEQLDSQLCDGTERLLEYRSLKLDLIPGYSFALESKGNGTLNVDVLTNNGDDTTGRSTRKKLTKQFYRILPMLMVPGLIMSAILPFVLPALKMMTMGAIMINNMAFTGAVFTLLRNNAFTDYYEKKIIYTNKGYLNEKHSPFYTEAESHIIPDQAEPQFSDIHTHDFDNIQVQNEFAEIPVDQYPSNAEFLKEYYGENPKLVNNLQEKSEKRLKRRKSGSRRRKYRGKKRIRQAE